MVLYHEYIFEKHISKVFKTFEIYTLETALVLTYPLTYL